MNAAKPRRIAAKALQLMTQELGTLAIHFDSTDPSQWLIHGPERVGFTRNGRSVAEVLIRESEEYEEPGYFCDVIVKNVYDIIRKPSEFDPAEHGIEIDPATTVFGDKINPDIDVIVLVEYSDKYEIPEAPVRRYVSDHKPRVIGSLRR